MAKILVIDDDELICRSLELQISDMGHDVVYAHSIESGLKKSTTESCDVVILDVGLPDGNGLDAIDKIRKTASSPEIIVFTGMGVPNGVEIAVENEVWDYVRKPASPGEIKSPLVRALQYRAEKGLLCRKARALKRCGIIGNSDGISRVMNLIAQAADSDTNVLITGETGTGKELFAKAIHANSPRNTGAFVVVDCSSLTESLVESVLYGHAKGAFTGADRDRAGLFRQADGGTLFLDEVGELPLSLQRTFLRGLQERRFRPVGSPSEVSSNFRLIAATNRDLNHMVEIGSFRSDLLFRLKTIHIEIPPLRERREDIQELVTHAIQKFCRSYGIPAKEVSSDFFSYLEKYHWPGNIRELISVIEGMIVRAKSDPTLFPNHLPGPMRIHCIKGEKPEYDQNTPPRQEESDQAHPLEWNTYKQRRDREYFHRLMEFANFELDEAARISGLSVPSLYRYLKLNSINTRKNSS